MPEFDSFSRIPVGRPRGLTMGTRTDVVASKSKNHEDKIGSEDLAFQISLRGRFGCRVTFVECQLLLLRSMTKQFLLSRIIRTTSLPIGPFGFLSVELLWEIFENLDYISLTCLAATNGSLNTRYILANSPTTYILCVPNSRSPSSHSGPPLFHG